MGGRLSVNVLEFGRLLRRAGLPVGPSETIAAAEALTLIDFSDKSVMRAALAAVMLRRHEHRAIFDAAFDLFWRDPEAAKAAAALAALSAPSPEERKPDPGMRRLAEAYAAERDRAPPAAAPETSVDAVLTVSDQERLQRMDFEAMSAAEIAAARQEIKRLRLPLDMRPTRRRRPDARGPTIDLRRTLRESMRQGGALSGFARSRRQHRPPPLVVLCDISGSMARYAQVLLHFLHAATNDRDRVSVFLFGTRLTNITRQLRHRDPEVAFQMLAHGVPDWSGGTRIGESIDRFNRDWGRRVLGQEAIVLLITDGLDREGARGLDEAMARLHRSCRRLIWLNPLLRWSGYEPKSQGARAMMPHVDEFRPVHNLNALRDLITALSRDRSRRNAEERESRDLPKESRDRSRRNAEERESRDPPKESPDRSRRNAEERDSRDPPNGRAA
jgi:uncharacterized protein with von Willebrand factor type A (vWA) domain